MRLLLALDGHRDHESAAHAVRALVEAAGASVFLLNVLDPDDIQAHVQHQGSLPITPTYALTGTRLPGAVQEYARTAEDRSEAFAAMQGERIDYLREAAGRWFAGRVVEVKVEVDEHVADAIIAEAHRVAADIIVLASYHHSMVDRIRGALHEEVIKRAPVPVLVVGPEVVGQ